MNAVTAALISSEMMKTNNEMSQEDGLNAALGSN